MADVSEIVDNIMKMAMPGTYEIGSDDKRVENILKMVNWGMNAMDAKKIYDNYKKYSPMKVNDKYKHAMMNCLAAKRGNFSEKMITNLSLLKELYDVSLNKNTVPESDADMEANLLGRKLGRENIHENCDELVQKYYRP